MNNVLRNARTLHGKTVSSAASLVQGLKEPSKVYRGLSVLAPKATGFPIANRCKARGGLYLDELAQWWSYAGPLIPALIMLLLGLPSVHPQADRQITTQMKRLLALGRTFQESLKQKALRWRSARWVSMMLIPRAAALEAELLHVERTKGTASDFSVHTRVDQD